MPRIHTWFRIAGGIGLLGSIFWLVSSARAENWPQFRGPRADGTSIEKNVPAEWSAETNIAWKTPLEGEGHTSPIVWGDKLFLTAGLDGGHDRVLMAFDTATGARLWITVVVRSEDLEPHHEENNWATSGPVTDGRAIYTSFYANGRAHLAAHDFSGKEIWSASPLAFEAEHGYSYTPALWRDRLIFSFDQWAEPAILALDAATGKVVWRIDTPKDFCSNVPPFVLDQPGGTQVITVGNNVTRGIDPATGRVIWSAEGPTKYCVAGVAFGSGVALVSGGYPERHIMAIDPTGSGDVTKTHIKWDRKKGTTYVPSPVYVDGHFYMVTDGGIAFCYEAKTGEVKWEGRIGGKMRSSLVSVEGNLWITNEDGLTTVFKADPTALTKVRENDLKEFCYTTPAISGGAVYIRTGENLWRIGAPIPDHE